MMVLPLQVEECATVHSLVKLLLARFRRSAVIWSRLPHARPLTMTAKLPPQGSLDQPDYVAVFQPRQMKRWGTPLSLPCVMLAKTSAQERRELRRRYPMEKTITEKLDSFGATLFCPRKGINGLEVYRLALEALGPYLSDVTPFAIWKHRSSSNATMSASSTITTSDSSTPISSGMEGEAGTSRSVLLELLRPSKLPFTLHWGRQTAGFRFSCPICPMAKGCHGCRIQPSSQELFWTSLHNGAWLYLRWRSPAAKAKYYAPPTSFRDLLPAAYLAQVQREQRQRQEEAKRQEDELARRLLAEDKRTFATAASSSLSSSSSSTRDDALTVAACVVEFSRPMPLGGAWKCEACGDAGGGAAQQLTVWDAPPCLTLQLKRFRRDGAARTKIETPVEVPVDTFLLPWQARGNPATRSDDRAWAYRLYAVVLHSGTLHGGHYTAAIRSSSTHSWFLCNDSSVRLIPVADIPWANAYLLFYQKLYP